MGTMTWGICPESHVDTAMSQKNPGRGVKSLKKLMETAFYLTDASAGPRISGSPELKHAQDWAVNQFKKSWGCVNAKREPWGKV